MNLIASAPRFKLAVIVEFTDGETETSILHVGTEYQCRQALASAPAHVFAFNKPAKRLALTVLPEAELFKAQAGAL